MIRKLNFLIFISFICLSCFNKKDNSFFVVNVNENNLNLEREKKSLNSKFFDNVIDSNVLESFNPLINLEGFNVLQVLEENLDINIYIEQVLLVENLSTLKTYLYILGFNPVTQSGYLAYSYEVNLNKDNSYNLFVEDITGDYDLEIILQGFSDDKALIYIFKKSNIARVESFTPIFKQEVNGSILIDRYERSPSYEERKSKESYNIIIDRYLKQDDNTVLEIEEVYSYNNFTYQLINSKQKRESANQDLSKILGNKEKTFKFLNGTWFDLSDEKKLSNSMRESQLISFDALNEEIQLYMNVGQEILKPSYSYKPSFNTLFIKTTSIFSDLIVYNFSIKILDINTIELRFDSSYTYVDTPGFSGVFKRLDHSYNLREERKVRELFIPSGSYVYKDKVYNFSYPNLTYTILDKSYNGLFDVFNFNGSLILELQFIVDEKSRDTKAYELIYTEKIVKGQKFSSIILTPVKILQDKIKPLEGAKIKLERIEKVE